MIAYHGKEETKQFYLNRVLEHQRADEIIKGTYWEGGKGCAVGCTLHSNDHKAYERELGVPEWLALVEDKLFEGMSDERSKLFPIQFLEAINVGSDLDKIKAPFMIFILQSALENFDHSKDPECKKAIDDVIKLWEKYPEGPGAAAWSAAQSAAWSAESTAAAVAAAEAAAEAAALAAESAAGAAAASSAWSSAWSAAWSSAWSAAQSAAKSAALAASSAWSSAWSAGAAAKSAAYEKFADKLLELMKECI